MIQKAKKLFLLSLVVAAVFIFFFSWKSARAQDSSVVNLIVSGCNNNLMCEPGLGEDINSCPLDCPAAIPGSGPGTTTVIYGEVITPTQQSFTFQNFVVNASTSSATVRWTTDVPTHSNVGWGSNYDGAGGTISEATFREQHEIEITGLQPGKNYVVTVLAVALNGSQNYVAYTFSTVSVIDSTPPLNIINFRAEKSLGNNVILTWDKPYDPDYYGVRITRGTRFYPRDADEGQLVYDGTNESTLDTSAVPNTLYYYSAFSYDRYRNYSSGAVAQYRLVGENVLVKNPSPTSTPATPPLFGGVVSSSTIPIENLIFEQEGKKILPQGDEVDLNSDHEIGITVPREIIPHNTEQIIVTINQDGNLKSYMLKMIDGGSAKVIIPGFKDVGAPKFIISFLSRGSEIRSHGTLNIHKFIPSTTEGTGFHLSFLSKILILLSIISCFTLLVIFIKMLLRM